MGFSRQEYLSGLPCLAPGDLPDPFAISPAMNEIFYCSISSPAIDMVFFVCFVLATLIGVTYREAWNAVVHGGHKGLLSCV